MVVHVEAEQFAARVRALLRVRGQHRPWPRRRLDRWVLLQCVARRVRTGQVSVNGFGPGGAPFGGFNQSGFGRESGGIMGIRQYMEPKAMGLPA